MPLEGFTQINDHSVPLIKLTDAAVLTLQQANSSWTNGDVSSHTIGKAVYLSGIDVVKLAKADLASTCGVVALATATIAASGTGIYQTSGVLAGLSGLTADTTYYLSETIAGSMTTTPPSSAGQFVVEIGVATSTTEILIRPRILVAI